MAFWKKLFPRAVFGTIRKVSSMIKYDKGNLPYQKLESALMTVKHNQAVFCSRRNLSTMRNNLPYKQMQSNINRMGKPLSLTEKILFSHLEDPAKQDIKRGVTYLQLKPDRVAYNAVQMPMLPFMNPGPRRVSVPTSFHSDHFIQAQDLKSAKDTEKVIYELKKASEKCGIDFWRPGSGSMHQIILEKYAFPGQLMVGTDSQTRLNAGGLGSLCLEVGWVDAIGVMSNFPLKFMCPKIIGVHLTGKMKGRISPNYLILKVADILTVKGCTGAVIEYHGPGVDNISCTDMGTICNMGAEIGVTSSLFPYNRRMADYLKATSRGYIAEEAEKYKSLLTPDKDSNYDQLIEIDLTTLEAHLNGRFTPDLARPIVEKCQKKDDYILIDVNITSPGNNYIVTAIFILIFLKCCKWILS